MGGIPHKDATLEETLDFLRESHRKAPFLLFNGNTFAEIGRGVTRAVFADLSGPRMAIVVSAVAHYIAGVPEMDKTALANILTEIGKTEYFAVGDQVQSLRGHLRGIVRKILPDGRLELERSSSGTRVIASPESLRHALNR